MFGNSLTSVVSVAVIVIAFIFVDIDTLHAQESFNLDGCSNNCGAPNGICIADGNKTNCTITAYETCIMYRCACVYGFSGIDCSLEYETCTQPITSSPDGAQQCFNGGKCEYYRLENTDNDNEEVQYGTRCNCQSLPNDAIAYAGHQCEFPSEQVCVRDAKFSTYAFCVNGGTCKELVDYNEEHPLCNCPPGYGGRHCQFKININPDGTFELPEDELKYLNTILQGNQTVHVSYKQDVELSGGMKFFIVILVFGLCIIPCCCYYRIKKQRSTTNANETTPSSINKESDGTTSTEEEEAHKDQREII